MASSHARSILDPLTETMRVLSTNSCTSETCPPWKRLVGRKFCWQTTTSSLFEGTLPWVDSSNFWHGMSRNPPLFETSAGMLFIPMASTDFYLARNAICNVSPDSPCGLVQIQHQLGGTIEDELDRILKGSKDIKANVNASLQWLRSQPDWNTNATLYWNAIFVYDPKNPLYQQASEFFWQRYSQELDSWRDQPLWAYTLSHLGIAPVTIDESDINSFIVEDLDLKGIQLYDEMTVSQVQSWLWFPQAAKLEPSMGSVESGDWGLHAILRPSRHASRMGPDFVELDIWPTQFHFRYPLWHSQASVIVSLWRSIP